MKQRSASLMQKLLNAFNNMFEKFKRYRQKFSYTRLNDDVEFLLKPILLNLSEDLAFYKVEKYVSELKKDVIKVDREHHEIFLKEELYETTYLFTTDENKHALISVSTYANKKGISYKKLLDELSKLKEIFSSYLLEIDNN